MSRSSNKSRARARAERRARHNRKRPRQQRRDVGRPGRSGGTFSAVPTPWGMPAMVGAVSDESFADYQTYLGAHSLLPPMPPWASSPKPVHIARALELLASPNAPSESRLWAIVVLGHTPRRNALEALREHGRSQSRYAGVARLAADECHEWIRLAEDEAQQAALDVTTDAAAGDESVVDRACLDEPGLEDALGPGWAHPGRAAANLLN